MHCTIMLLAHICIIYLLGHMYAEMELEVQAKQGQAEDFANLVLGSRQTPVHLTNVPCLLF
jgi:hypothetical protein